jgi:molecular chaperone GrpE
MTKKPDPKHEELTQLIDDLTAQLQRERADSVNLRRRTEEEKLSLSGFYKTSVMKELLPFFDSFEMTFAHMPNTDDAKVTEWMKGLVGTKKVLDTQLEKLGFKKIPTVGEVFNPEQHEAVALEDEGGDVETVSEELQAGYMLGEQVVRSAYVKVKK